MEHRKRSMMQHKVELSTLLKIVAASSKANAGIAGQNKSVTRSLAERAIAGLQNTDKLTNHLHAA